MKISRTQTQSKLIATFIWNGKKGQKTYYGEDIEAVKKVVAHHFKGATNIEVKKES